MAAFGATKEIIREVFATLSEEEMLDLSDYTEEFNLKLYQVLADKIDEIIERRML